MDRRPAHVQPRDDAQDADRLRHGADLSRVAAESSEYALASWSCSSPRVGQRVDIARAFRAAGAVTLGVDADPLAPALYHCDRRVIVPRIADPGLRPDARRARARSTTSASSCRSTISTSRCSRASASELAPALVLLPDADASARMSDKLEAHHFFVANGIPSPRSWAPEDVPADARYPVLVKAREGFGSRNIHRAADRGRARVLPRATRTCRRSCRRRCLGEEFSIDVFSRHGRALPERDSAHDASVEGRRVDQGRLDQGSRADRARRPRRGDRRHQGPGERAVLPRAGRHRFRSRTSTRASAAASPFRSPRAAATRSSRSLSRAASGPSRGSATSPRASSMTRYFSEVCLAPDGDGVLQPILPLP